MNRMKITAGIGLTILAGGAWLYRNANATEAGTFRLVPIERGTIQATVAATGALGAVTTVQVGTQVSGQISAIYVDFNDEVKKGQLLARIDPTLQQQAVEEAQAGLERANAQLALAKEQYDRNKSLYEAQIVTAAEFDAIEANYTVAQASAKSAQIALDRARQNLAYTSIYAPIDGVIVERNVDVGQTVAASLSAPQLFLIANDLAEMQILASVDESDIGSIAEGQQVQFSVQSYSNEKFTGTVRQVRLQSATMDNVVNYTAVISVQNPDGKLLPGMTATVTFLTNAANDVLTVSNAALRFTPTEEMVGTPAADAAQPAAPAGSARQGARPAGGMAGGRAGGRAGGAAGGASRGERGTLWVVGEDGKAEPLPVTTGLSDGQKTEIRGPGVTEGMSVIAGTQVGESETAAPASSPFQPAQGSSGGRRPPGVP